MRVGIIIPTLHRDPKPIMRAVAQQTHPDCHAIIVCQSPTAPDLPLPKLVNIGVQDWVVESPAPFTLVHVPWQRGSSAARNLGMALLSDLGCQAVCFWDDDDTPAPNYVGRMLEALTEPYAAVRCEVMDQGQTLPVDHHSSASHLARTSSLQGMEWDNYGPGQDGRFWSSYRGRVRRIPDVLYHTGNDQQGGLRHPEGRF